MELSSHELNFCLHCGVDPVMLRKLGVSNDAVRLTIEKLSIKFKHGKNNLTMKGVFTNSEGVMNILYDCLDK